MPAPRKRVEEKTSVLGTSQSPQAVNADAGWPKVSKETSDVPSPQSGGCFRLRHVRVESLLQDGSLGLLLHGTSVVGFCSEEVAENGWLVGDQIVEINGQRVSAFDEFLERFLAAQVQGFPIVFSVLRREAPEGPESKDPLDSFFNETEFADLANQLKSKFGPQKATALPTDSVSDSIVENPYIQALRKRRIELSRSPEGWSDDYTAQSIAAQMASERGDALATLSKTETPRRAEQARLGGFGLSACISFRPCREKQEMDFRTTPRVDCDWDTCVSPTKVSPAVVTARGELQGH